MKINLKTKQALEQAWNNQYPVGQKVVYRSDTVVAPFKEGETRSPAWITPSGEVVVKLVGVRSYYSIESDEKGQRWVIPFNSTPATP
jgi:hypothetical protein